jgi:hypothetical protein
MEQLQLYIPRNMVCFKYIIVNTLHIGEKRMMMIITITNNFKRSNRFSLDFVIIRMTIKTNNTNIYELFVLVLVKKLKTCIFLLMMYSIAYAFPHHHSVVMP